jgi:hypothetical protein
MSGRKFRTYMCLVCFNLSNLLAVNNAQTKTRTIEIEHTHQLPASENRPIEEPLKLGRQIRLDLDHPAVVPIIVHETSTFAAGGGGSENVSLNCTGTVIGTPRNQCILSAKHCFTEPPKAHTERQYRFAISKVGAGS